MLRHLRSVGIDMMKYRFTTSEAVLCFWSLGESLLGKFPLLAEIFAVLKKKCYFCGKERTMERQRTAIIVGATSGIGREVAKLLVREGWRVGAVGRREELLQSLQEECCKSTDDGCVMTVVADVMQESSVEAVRKLVERMGGMDLFLLSSGIGFRNVALDEAVELRTVATNCEGFVRMVTFAFRWFEQSGVRGHIAVISSIAGTKGLGAAPAYSATKRFQNTYIESLSQLAAMKRLPIDFTDIRPGFVATDLLKGTATYPMLMTPAPVARSIVRAIERRKRVCTIDWRYRILVFFWRLIPRCIWVRLRGLNVD